MQFLSKRTIFISLFRAMFLYVVFRLLLAIFLRIQLNIVSWIIKTAKNVFDNLTPFCSSFLCSSDESSDLFYDDGFLENRPQRGIIIVCKLPLADRYRPRIAPYVGIYNACLVERVLTESMVSLAKNYQKLLGRGVKVSLNWCFEVFFVQCLSSTYLIKCLNFWIVTFSFYRSLRNFLIFLFFKSNATLRFLFISDLRLSSRHRKNIELSLWLVVSNSQLRQLQAAVVAEQCWCFGALFRHDWRQVRRAIAPLHLKCARSRRRHSKWRSATTRWRRGTVAFAASPLLPDQRCCAAAVLESGWHGGFPAARWSNPKRHVGVGHEERFWRRLRRGWSSSFWGIECCASDATDCMHVMVSVACSDAFRRTSLHAQVSEAL